MQKNITRIITWLAGLVLGLMVVVFPLGYYLISAKHLQGNLESEAEVNARIITGIINNNPRMWQFEELRLEEYLARRPMGGAQELRRIVNTKNELVAEHADPLQKPYIMRSVPLYDSGAVVGRLEIYRSLRPVIMRTGLIALLMLPLGIGAFIIVRVLPIRSIARSEEALRTSRDELEVKVRSRTAELQGVNEMLKIELGERMRAEKKLRESEDLLKTALKEKETLLREVYHRTKNNMQVILSLLKLQMASAGDGRLAHIFRDTEDRIMSMALVHEKLYTSRDLSRVDLGEYIPELACSLIKSFEMADRVALATDIEDIRLSIDSITPLGLIVNELMTNSLKYAFPGERTGEIKIAARLLEDGEMELVFSDNGVGLPEGMDYKRTETLGLKLVFNLSQIQLRGKLQMKNENGLEYRIRFRELVRKKRLQNA